MVRGADARPKSPQAHRASGGVCLLASCPVRDPIGVVVDSTAPTMRRRGALEPWALGVLASSIGPGLRLRSGPRIRLGLPSIGSLGLGRALVPRAEVEGMLGLCPVLVQKVRASAPKGYSPRAIVEASVVAEPTNL